MGRDLTQVPNGDGETDEADVFNERRFKVAYLSSITPRKILWMWKPWMARGKLSILEGDIGIGKSTITIDWAAIVSTGRAWPETWVDTTILDRSRDDPSGVVLVGVEDDIADTILPRFIAAGGDTSRVAYMVRDTDYQGDPKPFVIPDDIDELRYLINEVGATFVPIDPITAFLSTKLAKAGDDPSTRQARCRWQNWQKKPTARLFCCDTGIKLLG